MPTRPARPLILAAVVALAAAVAITPTIVGASGATRSAAPQKVELVTAKGTPLGTANGNLLLTVALPPKPIHLQLTSPSSGDATTVNLLGGIPRNAVVDISSITSTCLYCNVDGGALVQDAVIVAEDQSSCGPSSPTTDTIAQLFSDAGEPTYEFTYPTPREAPLSFTPTGPWCLGVQLTNTGQVFVTLDGSEATR